MKIGELIATLRTTVKAHRNDSKLTNQYLYNLLKAERANVLQKMLMAGKKLSIFNYQTICIPLKVDKYQDCECIAVGCDVLKGDVEIPSVITANGKPLILLRTFNHLSIPYVTPNNQKNNLASDTMAEVVGYHIANKKPIIWNTLTLKAIMVEGIFEDPAELASIQICGEDGTVYNECSFDPQNQEFPLEEALVPIVLDGCLKKLGIHLSIYTPKQPVING